MARPIFCATHPRACSTAFERVFMTRNDLECVHEPFGDAFYYGPERLSSRFENDEATRVGSGFGESTYKSIFDQLEKDGSQDKRIFIKDIIHYLLPPDGREAQIAPSLQTKKRGIGTEQPTVHGADPGDGAQAIKISGSFPYGTSTEPGNPTVVPQKLLEKFHFTFLIRDPHSSIPSYYRCTIPPLVEMTGFYEFYPNEAGYDELRRFFDYMKDSGQVDRNGPGSCHINNIDKTNGDWRQAELCVVDADDLLDDPEGIIKAYCKSIELDYDPSMLNWDTEEQQARAKRAFEKWKGFHEDAIDSKDLKPRKHKKARKTEEQWDKEWKDRYGEEGARIIRSTVDANMGDYLYLKQFAIKPLCA